MASLDKYKEISKQLSDLVTNYSAERDKKIADTKTQYGYDDKIANLENLKKTSLNTEKILRTLPQDIDNRLVGRRMTGSQRNRVLAKEQAPIAQSLADISTGVQAEQSGIDLVRNLINDVLGTTREDFTNKQTILNTDLGTAFNEYRINNDIEEQQRNRDFQANQNNLNRYSNEKSSTLDFNIFEKILEDERNRLNKSKTSKSLAQRAVQSALKGTGVKA